MSTLNGMIKVKAGESWVSPIVIVEIQNEDGKIFTLDGNNIAFSWRLVSSSSMEIASESMTDGRVHIRSDITENHVGYHHLVIKAEQDDVVDISTYGFTIEE